MSPDSLKTEILGASHIVFSVSDVAEEGRRLVSQGYDEHGANAAVPNPAAKAPFISGPIAGAAAMRLMVSAAGAPALELTCEPHAGGAPRFFEAVLAEELRCGPEEVLAALSSEPIEGLPGFRRSASAKQPVGVGALVLHARSEDEALPLWQLLGVEPERVGDDLSLLAVRGIRSSQRLHVYLRADRREPGVGHLNDGGVVCLSFFCKNADQLREAIASEGLEVGECFDIQPFEAPLRIFFMRNASGEIYEFLSIAARGTGRT